MKASDISDQVAIDAVIAMYGITTHPITGVKHLTNNLPSAALWEVQLHLSAFPPKVVQAKLRSLVRRKLLEGCACGCYGGFSVVNLLGEVESIPKEVMMPHVWWEKMQAKRKAMGKDFEPWLRARLEKSWDAVMTVVDEMAWNDKNSEYNLSHKEISERRTIDDEPLTAEQVADDFLRMLEDNA